ncbi:50S ribosomal protein L13 [Candidatus Woesearchaeota archaeon]|nr:50S ribosomal protein L13 [Candidatus Woesearchaeota archaeon]
MKIYDGENMILGRLAAEVAKQALMGEEVKVINSEKVFISGQRHAVFLRAKEQRDRKGYPLKSAVHSRLPERFVRRTIRGMLPWKSPRGKDAFGRVLCYKGVPAEFAGQKPIVVEKAHIKKLATLKYVSVGEVCKAIGGK